MSTILNIGIYMIASSFIMVGYVWIKYVKHSRLEFEQMLENEKFSAEPEHEEKILAA